MAAKKAATKTYYFGMTVDKNGEKCWDLGFSLDEVSHYEYVVEMAVPTPDAVTKIVRKVSFVK